MCFGAQQLYRHACAILACPILACPRYSSAQSYDYFVQLDTIHMHKRQDGDFSPEALADLGWVCLHTPAYSGSCSTPAIPSLTPSR